MLEALLLRGRRSLAFFAGIVAALLVLISSSWKSGFSTSPRKIVTAGLRSAQDRVSVVAQVDGFKDFVKEPGCDFTSFELHHPFSPRCGDRKSLLEAMSGGGRLGWDEPYWTRDCDMQWFTADEICDILSRFDHIYMIGDSMMRHMSQAMHVLMRANLITGGRATWREGEVDDPLNCRCRTVFNNPGCVWWSAVNTVDLLRGDPDSIYCKNKPAQVSWETILNYPLNEETLHKTFTGVESKAKPNGRDVFILGHGLWNDLEAETSMSWVEQIEAAMEAEMPAYFKPGLDPSLFPRLFVTPSAQGEGKPDIFHGAQNNIRLMRHTHDMRAFVTERGYEHLALYNMTVQSSSPDGTHATLENNLMKAMMTLNWLNMLDPTHRSKPPELPEIPKHPKWKIKPSPQQHLMEADPANLSASIPSHVKVETVTAVRPSVTASSSQPAKETTSQHPIDTLVEIAEQEQEFLLKKRTTTLSQAAKAYRSRRGRNPPPRFDRWIEWCTAHNVTIIEDLFDQIYTDLAPFWAVSPQRLRDFPKSWMNVLSIRNGSMRRWEDEPDNIANWMDFWYNGLSRLPLVDLPDIDLAFNGEDEPKLFVPWETVSRALSQAEYDKQHHPPSKARRNAFASYPPLPARRPNVSERTGFAWADFPEDRPLWLAGRETCDPASAARTSPAAEDYSRHITFPDPRNLSYMHGGFVANWTQAKSTCHNPHLRSLHGTWIGMLSSSDENPRPGQKALITDLVPLLAGCKLQDVNAEILVPPAMHWPSAADASEHTFNFQERARTPWRAKRASVMWRGSASGGVNDARSWTRFHRHRFLAMLNGSLVAAHARAAAAHLPPPAHVPGGTPPLPYNFPLPNTDAYPLAVARAHDPPAALHAWLANSTDAAFVHLRCFPPPSWFSGTGQDCAYSGRYYRVAPVVPSAAQFAHKLQPDLDGASYSGRYRALLFSNALPLKATLFAEWHDARLRPWAHFVPMDNAFVDWWALLEFFLGYEPAAVEGAPDPRRSRPARDEVAERIASGGAQWAAQVLRTDDMLAYMYRLILELARLSDDERFELGFVEDLGQGDWMGEGKSGH